MRCLAIRRSAVLALVALLLVAALSHPGGADRATTPLALEGHVLTGDGAGVVRGASVSLLVYNATEELVHLDFTVTGEGGDFNFTVPADRWDPGWNVSLQASYSLVGAEATVNVTLSSSTTQQVNVTLPWDRTLGATITVAGPHATTPRDGLPTYVVNVTNAGNDTDVVLLWATPANSSIQAVFHPRNRSELAPGERKLVSLLLSNPGLQPGDYAIDLEWRSEWYGVEGGTVHLTWTVLPEVDLALVPAGVSWWPDPLFEGDDALLNCTVLNAGRDAAELANVTVELVHPSTGQVLRDRVRVDVPARGSAVARFPWRAVYSEGPYRLTFEVEHPLDKSHGDDRVEVHLSVGVLNVPPRVTFLAPANGTHVNGTAVVRLRVTDDDTPVERVRMRIGEGDWIVLPVTAEPEYSWDTTGHQDGWYVLEAFASDRYADGEMATLELKVENQGPNHAPEIYIEVPKEGDTVADTLRAEGIAFDTDDNVEAVRLRIDGGDWVLAEGTNRWSANLSTDGLEAGSHLLEVQADDGIDLSEIETVQFTVTDRSATLLTMSMYVHPTTALPSERVRVHGELVYDNGVRAEGLQVRIEGPNGLLMFKATDTRGVFVLSTVSPGSEGLYEYRASATDGGGMAASNTTQLEVLKSRDPDLAVTAIRIESEKVAVDIEVTVAVDLRNLGFTPGNGTLRAWEGASGSGEPIEERFVTVYDNITVSFIWVPSATGEVDLTVEVVDVQPADANLSNNRRVEPVSVIDLPDLVLANIAMSNPRPNENTTVTVSVRVENGGGLNASCTVKLYLDGTDPEHKVGDSDVAVGVHGFAYATFELRASKGPHLLYAEIVNTYPEESTVDNNNGTYRFTAIGPYMPPTDGEDSTLLAGMDPVTFVAILVVATVGTLVAVLYMRRG